LLKNKGQINKAGFVSTVYCIKTLKAIGWNGFLF